MDDLIFFFLLSFFNHNILKYHNVSTILNLKKCTPCQIASRNMLMFCNL